MERNKKVGFTIKTDILIDESILDKNNLYFLMCEIENLINHTIEDNYKMKVISGKGRYIYVGEDGRLIKGREFY